MVMMIRAFQNTRLPLKSGQIQINGFQIFNECQYFCHSTYVAEVIEMVMVKNQPKIKNVWCAVDCGIVINKDSAKNMIEGSIIDGIGHALYSELDFKDGRAINNNFEGYSLIRFHQSPMKVKVYFEENNISPT